MAYCTLEDLRNLIPEGELAQLTGETGEMADEAVVAAALAQADAQIDAYIGGRYAVPLNPAPPLVKGLAADLALYHLYSRRSVAPPVRQKKYDAALFFLKEISAGEASLEALGITPSGASREAADLKSAPRVFNRDRLGEW